MCAMTERTYYFQIPAAQVREGIRAENFQQAKAEVFNNWILWWDQIYWENDDETNHLLTDG
jgi:phage terminase large subunit-like protein